MGGFFESIGNALSNTNLLGSIIQTGAGLISGISQADAQEEAIKAKKESDKFDFLLQLAKLKYGQKAGGGGGGGGGGSLRNKNADLIEALSAGTDDQLKALQQFSNSYVSAVK